MKMNGGTTQTPQTPPSLNWAALLDGADSDAPPPSLNWAALLDGADSDAPPPSLNRAALLDGADSDAPPPSLNWAALLDSGDSDAPPPRLLVNPSSSDPAAMDSDGLDQLTDHQLRETIRNKKRTLETCGKKLPDGGFRIRAAIKLREEELSRRKFKGHQETCQRRRNIFIEAFKSKKKAISPSSEHQRKKPKISEKLVVCLDRWAERMRASIEASKAKAERYKAQTCSLDDPYSIDVCMELLDSMDGVPGSLYNNSTKIFKDPDWRCMFIKMPAFRRKSWLESFE